MTYTDPMTRELAARLTFPMNIDGMRDSEFDDWFDVAWIMTMLEEPELLLGAGEAPPVIPSNVAERARAIDALICREMTAATVH
ncbi:hypothetical protein [Sphingopyxis sp. GW247-27LB]|uniref:hypothetical protein n=1 Tax=Sphingopyxis sp. GW247-27LB TaxID=2012632 RepID=UPI000BA4FA6C|nr:hypothetical protein [Sphingopyxis sp. GW247-27LB]PAL23584.1 hypothetical protein CD928_05820 [Sphingopyxis sp. GW247-27LB]